jgi:hypothetical protein
MVTTLTQYEHYLRMGSGANNVKLIFCDDGSADIYYSQHWMGNNHLDCKISCLHQPASDNHGFIRVTLIRQLISGVEYGDPIYSELSSAYAKDVYGLHVPEDVRSDSEILYEYLILDKPAWHFSGDQVLDEIRLTTGAEWNDTFTLFLRLIRTEGISENDTASEIAQQLSQLKMSRLGDERMPTDVT